MHSRWLVFLVTLIASLGLGRPAPAADQRDHDLWYVVEMAGKRAGWMHSIEKADAAAGTITVSSDMQLSLKRGDSTVTISMSTASTETTAGKPVSMRRVQALGSSPVTTVWTFGPEHITAVTTEGKGEPTTTQIDLPDGTWLMPAAAEQFIQKRLEAGATTIEVSQIDPENGPQPYRMTMKVLERTTIDALGKTVPAIKVTEATSVLPGVTTTEYIDERGNPIRTTVSFGGPLSMTILAADKELAQAALDPPELMQRTLVTPDRPIAKPRQTRKGAFVLSVPDGTMPPLPSAGRQRAEAVDERSVRVTVDLATLAAPAAAADTDNKAFRARSDMLDCDNAAVKELATRAVERAKEKPPTIRAEAMRRFVNRYIKEKDLDVGFASATEVARTKQGDCTEHACLLAAMLRADGIPSRVVSGLLYTDQFAGAKQIFAYHMWTQALLEVEGEKRWVDLDATLPPETPFDATHIALAVSALSDNEPQNPLVALVPLLGRVAVKVEKAE